MSCVMFLFCARIKNKHEYFSVLVLSCRQVSEDEAAGLSGTVLHTGMPFLPKSNKSWYVMQIKIHFAKK